MHVVKTAAQDADDVANGSAFGRSDESDAAGEKWKRFFVRGVEEAFGVEAFLELLEGELQRVDAEAREILGKKIADARGEFADGEGAARRLEVELELAHGS